MLAVVFSTLPSYSSRQPFRVTCHSTTQAKNKSNSIFEQFYLFLPTQSQREAPARANNILRHPPSEPDKLKMRSNGLPKNILWRLPSEADTVRVRRTDPAEIYLVAHRVIQVQSQWKILVWQKYTSTPTEWNRKQSREKVAPKSRASYLHSHGLQKRITRARVFSPKHYRMGTAGSVRFLDLTQQGYGKWRTEGVVEKCSPKPRAWGQ